MIADLCLDLWNVFGSALVWLAVTIGGAAAIALAWEHLDRGPKWPDIRELSEADTQEMDQPCHADVLAEIANEESI